MNEIYTYINKNNNICHWRHLDGDERYERYTRDECRVFRRSVGNSKTMCWIHELKYLCWHNSIYAYSCRSKIGWVQRYALKLTWLYVPFVLFDRITADSRRYMGIDIIRWHLSIYRIRFCMEINKSMCAHENHIHMDEYKKKKSRKNKWIIKTGITYVHNTRQRRIIKYTCAHGVHRHIRQLPWQPPRYHSGKSVTSIWRSS